MLPFTQHCTPIHSGGLAGRRLRLVPHVLLRGGLHLPVCEPVHAAAGPLGAADRRHRRAAALARRPGVLCLERPGRLLFAAQAADCGADRLLRRCEGLVADGVVLCRYPCHHRYGRAPGKSGHHHGEVDRKNGRRNKADPGSSCQAGSGMLLLILFLGVIAMSVTTPTYLPYCNRQMLQ